jgi:hypothetical protein
MKRTAAVAFVFALFTLASAFNHPEIRWKSVTTAHFIINYYDRTEPAVYATWKIAEAAYESLSSLYEYEERSKINISLADYDDYANGFASWTNGSIVIWVTDIRFDLRGNNTWLNNVITHELAHIMTLEKRPKMQLFDWTFALGYSSPFDTLLLAEPFATTRLFPEWFTEGISQRETERRGNDCWDSRRDMLLKDAIISDQALTLREMGHFNHNSIGSELVYNQGFSFVKYIEGRIGTPNLARIFGSSRNNALVSDGFYSMFENQTGLSLDAMYVQWKDSLRAMYAQTMPPHPTKTDPVWSKGFLNAMPKVSPDRKWWGWLTNDNDDFSRTDLVIAPYGSSAPYLRLKRALSSWDFSADSRRVFFIKSYGTSDNGSFFNDLYVADLTTKEHRRLTRGARIYDVAACPDNRRIACVQFRNGVFSIVTAGTDGCCWETLVQGEIGRPFAGLSFSPVKTTIPQPPAPAKKDGAAAADSVAGDTVVLSGASPKTAEPSSPAAEYMLATTRVINGKATLGVVGFGRTTFTMIGSGAAQEEGPHWASDGRIYFDADYDGTFNIYSVKPDGSGLCRHTEAQFGMMSPFTDNNGKLLCVSYANRAFSIVSFDAGAGSSYALPKQYACSFTDLPRPKGEVTIKSRPYEAKLLRPVWELQSACEVSDRYGTFQDAVSKNRFGGWFDSTTITAVTGVAMSRADALDKKSLSFGAMAAIIHSGLSRDSARSDTTAGHFSMRPQLRPAEIASRLTGSLCRTAAENTAQSLSRTAPLIKRLRSDSKMTSAMLPATDTAGDSTAALQQWLPVLDPFLSYMNNTNALSFGLDADVMLLYFIPYVFRIQGTSTWHIARDVYAGLFPGVEIVPLAGFAIPDVNAALALLYATSGYMNTDIGYNRGGVTQLQLTIVPESFIPLDDTTTKLASIERVSALTVQIDAMHAFPFRKYFSLELRTRESYSTFSQPVLDRFDLLPEGSAEYLFADVGASFVFPLWRQINGGPAYADALYGAVGYDVQMLSNTTTFQGDFLSAFSVPSYDKDHIIVSHVFSAGVKFGFFKSYLFNRTLQAKAYWDVWKKKLAVNLAVGM